MVFDLGFIKAIHSGPVAPVNTQMLWYDTNVSLHKYYDSGSTSWISLVSGASSWNTVLASGAASLGISPIISPGDGMLFENGGFQVRLETGVLTGNHIAQFQNASGVIAYLSDVASAGNLNAVLTAGNTTSGVNIVLSTGDLIAAAAGTASISLRDGADGRALLSGASRSKVYSPIFVALESGVLITMKHTSGPTNSITVVGFGINTGTPASLLHVEVVAGAPSAAATSVLRVTNGTQNLHVGVNTGYDYIQSHAGWLSLNPAGTLPVGLRNGTQDPAVGGSDVVFGVGSLTGTVPHSIAIYSNFPHMSFFKTFRGPGNIPVMRFGNGGSGGGIIENLEPDKGIGITANKGGIPMNSLGIWGPTGSAYISNGLTIISMTTETFALGAGANIPAINVENKIAVELDITPAGTCAGIDGYYQNRVLMITNINAAALTFTHATGGVGNAGKMILPGAANMTLNQFESAMIIYQEILPAGAGGGWRVLSRT